MTDKRLIDANALKARVIRVSTVKEHCYMKAVGTHEIDKAPTLDAVEVVRCRECYFGKGELICTNPKCGKSWHGCPVPPEHYCSYGERRTDGI